MNQIMQITLDSVTYNVGVEYESLERSFEIREGDSKGTSVNGNVIRDLIGTFYSYKLKVRALPENQSDYNDFYIAVSRFNNIHTITLPFGQDSYTFDCYIDKGEDVYEGYYATYQRWDELNLTIEPIEAAYEAAPYVPPGLYYLNYNPNAGSDSVSNMPAQQSSGDGSFIVSYQEPERYNYLFRGWNTNSSASEPTYFAGDPYTSQSSDPDTTNFYAVWRVAYTYRLNMYPNYSGASYTQYTEKSIETSFDFPITDDMTPTRPDYRFLYWSTSASDSGGTRYNIGEKVHLTAPSVQQKNLYAIWDEDHSSDYSLVYSGNSSNYTVYGVPNTQYNSTPNFIISGNVPNQIGHEFLGWARTPTATAAQFQPNGSINISNYTQARSLTLYAIWKSNRFVLKYNANGGTGTMEDDEYDYPGSRMTAFIKRSLFSLIGSTQVGWSNSAGAENPLDYVLGSSIMLNSGEEKTIYAVWTNKKYTLIYSAGIYEEEVSIMPQSPQYSDEPAFAIPNVTPTRQDATFIGWSESTGGEGTLYKYGTENDTYTFSHEGVVTLYAIWQGNYKLYFNANAGQDTVINMPEENPQSSDINQFTIRNYPNVPVRGDDTVYTFTGWGDTPSATQATYGWTTGLSPNVVVPTGQYTTNLYAVWARKDTTHKFELYYDANGGFAAPALKTYFASTPTLTVDVDIISQPAWNEHTFLGWDTNQSAVSPTYPRATGGRITLSYESLTVLYAIWKSGTEYSLEYIPNASSVSGMPSPNPQVETVPYFVTPSTSPTRTGYTFKGWAPEGWQTGTEARWQPGDTIEMEAVKLGGQFGTSGVVYAIWEEGSPTPSENTFTLKHNANGGSYDYYGSVYPKDGTPSSDSSQTITIATSPVPTRTGYSLIGWSNTSGDNNTVDYTLNGSVTVYANTEKVIYAVWQASNTFTLRHHANSGSYTYYGTYYDKPGSASTASSQTIAIATSPVPSRAGYTLIGWSNSYGDGNTSDYSLTGSVTVSANTTKTIYAVWRQEVTVQYRLYYDANGGRSAPSYAEGQSPTFTISSSTPARDPDSNYEYAFAGWGLSSSTTTVSYNPGGTINISSHTQNTSLTLYAVWNRTARQYSASLILDATEGSFPNSAQTRTVYYTGSSSSFSVTIDTTVAPTRYGYTLAGWSDTSGGAAQYGVNGTITLTSGQNPPKTIYAVWSSVSPGPSGEYVLEYNGNAGQDTVTNLPATQYGTPEQWGDVTTTIRVNYSTTPRRTGYQFVGWSNSSGVNNTVDYQNGSYATVARNVTKTLYAVWQRVYTVTYYANGDSVTGMPYPSTQTSQSSTGLYTPSTNPSRTGYEFLGWSENAGAMIEDYWSNEQIVFGSGIYSINLFAIWALQGETDNILKLTLRSLKEANPEDTWQFPSWNGNVATLNGLTFTVNIGSNDYVESIIVNGTATANTYFHITDDYVGFGPDPVQKITVNYATDFESGPFFGGSDSTYYVSFRGPDENDYREYKDYGSPGGLEELPSGTYWSFRIDVKYGTEMDHVRISPWWVEHIYDIPPLPDGEEPIGDDIILLDG